MTVKYSDNIIHTDKLLLVSSTGELIQEPESDDITETIGLMPSWIFKGGMLVLIMVFLLMISGAYFFKYRDTVEAKCVIKMTGNEINASAALSAIDFKKLRNNDKVTIKISNYSANESSVIEGVINLPQSAVESLPPVADIRITAAGKSVISSKFPGSKVIYGTAEIVTEEKNILTRLFEKKMKSVAAP